MIEKALKTTRMAATRRTITTRALAVLEILRLAEDSNDDERDEIVRDHGPGWLGIERVSKATLDDLLAVVALTRVDEACGVERYRLNGTGRAILQNPALSDEIAAYVARGRGAFTIIDGKIVDITDDIGNTDPTPRRGGSR